ncbi:VWA domain-containing protein [Agromyces sp. PvR057]|uniref:vWA domain-containing protein n=1 Tax=Agromyces sp. PvR057 TaxID=3156403 RepID=UPI0033976569
MTEPTEPIDPAAPLVAAASDPAELASLAYTHPGLRAAIAANPAAYDGLREWIAANPAPAPATPARTPPRRRGLVVALAGSLALLLVGGGVATAAVLGAFGGGSSSGGASDANASGIAVTDSPEASDDGASAEPIVAPVPEPVPAVVILDASGSMVRDAPEGGTRMEAARLAVTTFVEGLPDGIDIGLTVFGTGTGNGDSERAAGCLDVKTVLPVAELDRTAMTQAVAGITESGFTPIGPALRHAAAQLPVDGPGVVVVVSDGVDTCAPPPSCDVATELRAANPELTIHAIGFHVDADEEATAALECVATAGGGEFFSATNAAQLAAKLRVVVDPGAASAHLTPTALDGARIGMSLEQAEAMLPGFERGRTRLGILFVDCDAAELRFRGGVLVEIRPKQRATATVDAIGPGLPVGTADQMYGAPIATGDDVDGSYADYATAPGSRTGYRVYSDSGTIRWIVLCLCGPNAAEPDTSTVNWVIGFDGVGPIELGMTREQTAVFGRNEDWGGNAYCPVWSVFGSDGRLQVFTETDASNGFNPGASIAVFGVVADAPMRTARGIGLSSTEAQVGAAYPKATVGTGKYGQATYAAHDAEGGTMLFEIGNEQGPVESQGRVVGIYVGTDQPWYEPCA